MKKNLKLMMGLLLVVVILFGCSNNDNSENSAESPEEVEIMISAAASLTDAMDVIQEAYEEENSGVTLNFNFGASGSLQQQISQGAPVDLFFSAAEDKFDILVDEGKIAKEDGVDLLGNSVVLVVPSDGDSSISSFEDLASDDVKVFTIGIPDTVPAGKYSKESLENMGLWDAVSPKIVEAKDVRTVLSYVEAGNAEAGMVYRTDAATSDSVTIVQEADPSTHTPVIYPVGLITDGENYEAAKDFYEYLQSDFALKVFEEYGFTIQ